MVEIEYDTSVIGFGDLLDLFWREHDPRREAPRQYRSVILYLDGQQREAAETSRELTAAAIGPVSTAIEPLDVFWPAEDYHQDYHWKQWARSRHRDSGPVPGPHSEEFCAWLTRDRFWSGSIADVLRR